MSHSARIIQQSDDGKRIITVDTEIWDELQALLKANPALRRKFFYVCQSILNKTARSDVYGKENINSECQNVTAIKLRSHQNMRIYCQEVRHGESQLIIVCAKVLPKKKNQKNKHTENSLIRAVATRNYTTFLEEE